MVLAASENTYGDTGGFCVIPGAKNIYASAIMSLSECKMNDRKWGMRDENVWTFIEKYSSDSTSSGITFHAIAVL